MAQRQEKKGRLLNTEDIENVHVFNLSIKKGTITDSDGSFELAMQKNDTIVLSSLVHELQSIIVTETMMNTPVLEILLQEKITQIQEVVIRPLTGDLSKDAENIAITKPVDQVSEGILPDYIPTPQEKREPIVPGIGIITAVNLEALYKELSGYYRIMETRRRWEREDSSISKLILYYTPQFFLNSYGIMEEDLYEFIVYTHETSDLLDYFNANDHNNVLRCLQEASIAFKEQKD